MHFLPQDIFEIVVIIKKQKKSEKDIFVGYDKQSPAYSDFSETTKLLKELGVKNSLISYCAK